MEFFHELEDVHVQLEDAIAAHSADECIVYKKVNGEPVYLGYYYPKDYDSAKKYPMFVFIHGGGWVHHKIFDDQTQWQGDYLGFLARYYAERGYLCVSLDYRLASEDRQMEGYQIVDCYEDCCDAMDYVILHAEEYGADTNRMYLLGESAGGHLAGAVATFHYDRRYTFRKVFLINAITDVYETKWKECVPLKSSHKALVNLSLEERGQFLSPLYQLDEGIGDVVLIHGDSDTIVSPVHSRKFYQRMEELGKNCELHMIQNTNHAFLLAEFVKDLRACKIGIEIMNQVLYEDVGI